MISGLPRFSIAVVTMAALVAPSCVVSQNSPPPVDMSQPPPVAAPGATVTPAPGLTSGATISPVPGGTASPGTDAPLQAAQLEELVGRIALYPDDLLAIVLPASTQPLQVVQAAQLLERRKSDPSAQPAKSWDPSIIALLNYPEVVAMMNSDLDWMQKLGDAVVDQQGPLLDAIQAFRAKVQTAGNLKSDDKMTVSTQEQKIIIEQSNPEVIYVPSYNPTTIVYPPPPAAPPPYYYSPPYPPYWAPGAAFFTGMFIGAAIGYGLSWGDNGIYHGDVNINNSNNVNVDRDKISNRPDRGDRGDRGNRVQQHGENKWRPNDSGAGRGRNDGVGGGRGQVSTRPAPDQIRGGLADRGGPNSQFGGAGPRPSTGAVGGGGSGFNQGRGPGGGGAGLNQGRGPGGGSNFGGSSSRPQAGAFGGANRSAATTRSYSSRGSASMGRSSGGGSRAASAPRGGGGGRGGGRR